MARKVVDELVVTLGLDMTGWNTGMAKAKTDMASLEKAARASMKAVVEAAGGEAGAIAAVAARARAAMVSGAKKADAALAGAGASGEEAGNKIAKGMRTGTLSTLSLLYAAVRLNKAFGFPMLFRWSEEVVESETKTLRLANALKLNTTTLQEWQLVMGRHGVEASAFNGSLERIAGNIGKLGTQVRGAKILQQYLGLSGITDEMVKGKNSLAFLQLFVDQMGKMTAERQFTVGRRLGLTNEEIEAIKEAGPALREQLAAAKDLAATQEELQNARDVAVAQKQLSQEWERAKQQIVSALLPVLKSLISALSTIATWARQHKTLVAAILIGIASALVVLGAAAGIAAAGMFSAALGAAGLSAGLAPLAIGLGVIVGGLLYLNSELGYTRDAMNEVRDAATGMQAATMGKDQKKDARFKRDEARRISIENYNAFKRDNERQLAIARADLASAAVSSRRLGGGEVSTIQGSAEQRDRIRELETRLALGKTHFDQFLREVKKEDGQGAFDKMRHGAATEALQASLEATRASMKIDTVNINVGTVKEAADMLANLPGHVGGHNQMVPSSASFAGGMSGY